MTLLCFEVVSLRNRLLGKITHGPLKFTSRRVRKGFQRTFQLKLRSGDSEKNNFWNMTLLCFEMVLPRNWFLVNSRMATSHFYQRGSEKDFKGHFMTHRGQEITKKHFLEHETLLVPSGFT
jgi:hypothetical protein